MAFLSIDTFDDQEIYCRKLGHHLHFSYCRQENLSSPCSAIRRCWQDRLDVEGFLKQHFGNDEIEELEQPPIPRMAGILDIVQKIQNSQ